MPSTLTRQIYRGWQRHESYWDTPGMNENLKVISDHLPALNVVGTNVSPLPSVAAEGETVLNLATGTYSVYSLNAQGLSSGWQTYPASKGMLALFNGAVYGSTGAAWEVVASNINIQQGDNITITGDGTQASPYVISARSQIVTNLGAFTMDNSTAPAGGEGGKLYIDTVPNGYNIGAGRMSFSADVVFNNYFTANPDGHMAIVLRQDPALGIPGSQGGSVRGNGVAIGNLVGAPEGTQVNPGAQVEIWANTVNPQQNRLVPGADSKEALQDGVYYKLLIESSVAPDGNKYARMAIYKQTARGYDCVVDTGDVLDTLAGSDFSKAGLLIGHVFGSNASGWSIQFTYMRVWWGPFSAKNTDTSYIESGGGGSDNQTLSISGNSLSISGGNSVTLPTGTVPNGSETKVTAGTNVTVTGTGTIASPYVINSTGGTGSATDRVLRAGDTMTGSLDFSGNSLRLGIPTYVGANYTNSFRFQNTQANSGTGLISIPNGNSQGANFTAGNNSDLAGASRYVSFGMDGLTAVINTFGLNGEGSPGLDIKIGGTTVSTFNQSGLAMAGASKYIGEDTTLLTGPFNLGGFNANVLGVAGLDLEIMSTSGTIKGYLQGQGLTASQADGVESITRPLYAFMSCLLAELKYRKVI